MDEIQNTDTALDDGDLAFSDSSAAMAQLGRYVKDLKWLLREKDSALDQLEHAHYQTLSILSRAAEFRDDDTGVHMDRVGALSELLARLAGFSDNVAQLLGKAAPMHDIGKIAIPDAVLKKPGKYSSDERCIMNNHTLIGAEIIGHSDIPLFRMASEVALTHHERWDGSGYPRGLSNMQIPMGGRVVSIIDFFDALTMNRVYRKAIDDDRALAMLLEQRGRMFDPALIDVFVAHADQFSNLRDSINAASVNQAVSPVPF